MAEKLPEKKRKKMERTLRRMEKVRRIDDMRLRELINAKREWVDKEREKGFNIIEQLDQQIEKIKNQQQAIREQILKLDGCALVLDDLIEESKQMDIEEAKKKEEDLKKAQDEVEEKTAKKDSNENK